MRSKTVTRELAIAVETTISKRIPALVGGPSLHEWTVRRKSGDDKLRHTGMLKNGLRVVPGTASGASRPRGSGKVLSVHTVGYLQGHIHSDSGLSLQRLAKIHEFGTMVPVTPKMRRFLAAQDPPLIISPRKRFIVIPARPFFGPGFAESVGPRGRATRVVDVMAKRWARIINSGGRAR